MLALIIQLVRKTNSIDKKRKTNNKPCSTVNVVQFARPLIRTAWGSGSLCPKSRNLLRIWNSYTHMLTIKQNTLNTRHWYWYWHVILRSGWIEESYLSDYRVIEFVPITDEDGEIISWIREWNRNQWSAKDFDGSKTTSSFVESKRWKIKEASNLIFDLKLVCEVFTRRNGTCCTINSILKRVSSLLNTVPVSFQYNNY